MGMVYDDLPDHEGYAARRLPDGTLTSSVATSSSIFDGYLAACECGWTGSTHPPDEHGREAAEAEWDQRHALPLLRKAVPYDVAEKVAAARQAVTELAHDRPVAAVPVLQQLQRWTETLLPATVARERLESAEIEQSAPCRSL